MTDRDRLHELLEFSCRESSRRRRTNQSVRHHAHRSNGATNMQDCRDASVLIDDVLSRPTIPYKREIVRIEMTLTSEQLAELNHVDFGEAAECITHEDEHISTGRLMAKRNYIVCGAGSDKHANGTSLDWGKSVTEDFSCELFHTYAKCTGLSRPQKHRNDHHPVRTKTAEKR